MCHPCDELGLSARVSTEHLPYPERMQFVTVNSCELRRSRSEIICLLGGSHLGPFTGRITD